MQKKTETKPTTEKKPAAREELVSISIDDLEWITGGNEEVAATLQSGHDAQRV